MNSTKLNFLKNSLKVVSSTSKFGMQMQNLPKAKMIRIKQTQPINYGMMDFKFNMPIR